MPISEDQIQAVVRRVVSSVMQENLPSGRSLSKGRDGVYADINDAVDAAERAFRKYETFGLQDRKGITDAVRQVTKDFKEEFSRMAVEQTGMGRIPHKIAKHVNVARYSSGIEFLAPNSWSGKNGMVIEDYAPWGVIGNISPSTHPSCAILENIISQLSGGNAIVFNPHPTTSKLGAYVVQRCNQYIAKAGGPENLVTCVEKPTMDSAEALFSHPKIHLLSITGGPFMVAAAMKSNKPVVAAGPGNPPVLIDETADIQLAAREITESSAFDNNILCIAEKEIFVVESVFSSFMKAFEAQGNHKLVGRQMDSLASRAIEKQGKHYIVSRDYVGKNANALASHLGMHLSEDVPMLFAESDREHPWVMAEQMTSFIPVVRVRDFEDGLAAAKKAEHGFEHTASVFTKDMNRATSFAREMKTDIVVVNGGTLRGNGGAAGEAYFSHTIASPTGQGVTNPRDFCKRRRVMVTGAMRFV